LLQNDVYLMRLRMDQVQREALYLHEQIDSLRVEQVRVRSALMLVRQTLANQELENRSTRAELLSVIDQLQTQNDIVSHKLDDSIELMARFMQKVEPSSPSANAPPVVKTRTEAEQIFQSALADYSAANYTLALAGFSEYLNRFPDSEYVCEARFWMAEIYFLEDQLWQARQEFHTLLTSCQTSRRMRTILLRAANCALQLQAEDEAREYLTRLLNQYPDSQEARIAEQLLGNKP